jgi:heme O synthase-like polyprenyltransferase
MTKNDIYFIVFVIALIMFGFIFIYVDDVKRRNMTYTLAGTMTGVLPAVILP